MPGCRNSFGTIIRARRADPKADQGVALELAAATEIVRRMTTCAPSSNVFASGCSANSAIVSVSADRPVPHTIQAKGGQLIHRVRRRRSARPAHRPKVLLARRRTGLLVHPRTPH